LNQNKKIRLRNLNLSAQFLVNQLYIGGIDNFQRVKTQIRTYYSDEIEMADMRLNNIDIFDPEIFNSKSARILLDFDSPPSKVCSTSSPCFEPFSLVRSSKSNKNATMEIKMKETYRRFMEIENQHCQRGGGCSRNNNNNNNDTLNMTVTFSVNFASSSQSNPSEIGLIRSRRSILTLNMANRRIELIQSNLLRGWIDLFGNNDDTTILYTFTLISFGKITRMILNNQHKVEFNTSSSREILTSDFLWIDSMSSTNRISICLLTLYLNNDQVTLATKGNSKLYTTEIFTATTTSDLIKFDEQQCSSNVDFDNLNRDEFERNFNLINNNNDNDSSEASSRGPSTIIITVIICSIIAFVAVLSILINIYIRNTKAKDDGDHKNANVTSLKLNSRQEFEISLNISSQNSPVSSEVCSLSTNHSFNPYVFSQNAVVNRVFVKPAEQNRPIIGTAVEKQFKIRDECLLNCLNLSVKPESGEETYFEYDAFKMGDLTPHAEFIFKKVNLNKKSDGAYGNGQQMKILEKNEQSQQQTQASLAFETQDLDKLKSLLNWTPTYGHYEDVFDEFERFVSRKHVCNKCEHHIDSELKNHISKLNSNQILTTTELTSSSNFYDEFDKHTFV
jgi:hypothetical protein